MAESGRSFAVPKKVGPRKTIVLFTMVSFQEQLRLVGPGIGPERLVVLGPKGLGRIRVLFALTQYCPLSGSFTRVQSLSGSHVPTWLPMPRCQLRLVNCNATHTHTHLQSINLMRRVAVDIDHNKQCTQWLVNNSDDLGDKVWARNWGYIMNMRNLLSWHGFSEFLKPMNGLSLWEGRNIARWSDSQTALG